MRANLMRSGYTPTLNETVDFACGLITNAGELLAMSEDLPFHIFAVGFHALFDYAALYIFGAPNSGNRGGTAIDTRLFSGTFHGPNWLTGGPLGVEASWLVFPVIALLFLFFDRIHRAVRPVESPVGYDPPVSVQ